MEKNDIEILLSSDGKYERLTAEIFYKGKFIALLNQDDGIENMKIEFPYLDVNESMVLREVNLAKFEEAVDLAKKKMLGRG